MTTTPLDRIAACHRPDLPDSAAVWIPEGNGDLRWLKEAMRAGALAQETRYRQALEEIRDHWANQYDHPRKESEMYRGPYGIGVTDGHRACTIIAERALALPSTDGADPATLLKNLVDALDSREISVTFVDGAQTGIPTLAWEMFNNILDRARDALPKPAENTSREEWRCFHCGFVAKTDNEARNHFGPTMDYQSACQGEGGQWAQKLRHHVRSFLNGIDTGAVRLETDQDETLERNLSNMRFAIENFEAQKSDARAALHQSPNTGDEK